MRQAFYLLSLCIALAISTPEWANGQAAAASSSPSPSSAANPPLPFRMITRGPFVPPPPPSPGAPSFFPTPAVLYVLATGGDATTRQRFVANLTQKLQTFEEEYRYVQRWNSFAQHPVSIVPEPDWSVSDYTSACQSSYDAIAGPDKADKSDQAAKNNLVAGALIVQVDSLLSWVDGHLWVYTTNRTNIWANLYYSACDTSKASIKPNPAPPDVSAQRLTATSGVMNGKPTMTLRTDYAISTTKPKAPPPYYIAWQTQLYQESGHQGFVTPTAALSVVMTGVAAWAAFTPTVVKSTTNTTLFATPTPGVPVPPFGYVSQSITANSKTTNANQFAAISNAFLSSQNNITTSLPLASTNDKTTADAVKHVVDDFLLNDAMNCPPKPVASPDTDPQNVRYRSPYTICFSILTWRNDGHDPTFGTQYKTTIGTPTPPGFVSTPTPAPDPAASKTPAPENPVISAFSDCLNTYLELKPSVTQAQIVAPGSAGSNLVAGSAVIYGQPPLIYITAPNTNKGADAPVWFTVVRDASAKACDHIRM